jgi:hypothetical protein
MVRRSAAVAVGVIAGPAPISTPAAATSEPVTGMKLWSDAVPAGSVRSNEVAVTPT